jgi:hypothetical protein
MTRENLESSRVAEANERPENDPYLKRLAQMQPGEKLLLSLELYESARTLKASALRSFNPDWSEAKVDEEVRRIFANART